MIGASLTFWTRYRPTSWSSKK